jgi:hypothetical protein
MQYRLSSNYCVTAKANGKVVEYDEASGQVVVEYEPYGEKKYHSFNINTKIVKNGGGGFYLNNRLTTDLKLGDKFKKDEILAYHAQFFTKTKHDGLRYNVGPLVKVAVLATSEVYEDGNVVTDHLCEKMKTDVVYQDVGQLDRNSNIIKMIKIGDHVDVDDVLIQFDTSFDDRAINKLLATLGEDSSVAENMYNSKKAKHSGVVKDIKIYTAVDEADCSPSIQKMLKAYRTRVERKIKILDKYDKAEGIVKAGYMITDAPDKVQDKYGKIKGIKTDILIEFYIEHRDKLGVGDKIVVYSSNKNIIGNVISDPKFYPYSESAPDEPIDLLCSPSPLEKRMLTSSQVVIGTNRVLKELKNSVSNIYKLHEGRGS